MFWPAPAVAFALILSPLAGSAAVLIEGRTDGLDLRVVADRQQQRVLIEKGSERALVDLAAGDVYLGLETGAPEHVHAYFRPGHDEIAPYRLERFGPGPVMAGHASTYYVLFAGERVCAEILSSAWMRPFVDPAVQALAVLDAIKQPQVATAAGDDACAHIPLATTAAAGWPLLSGKIDHPTFTTEAIRFDYEPAPGELALPVGVMPAAAPDPR
jgi:hypothetical protein